MLRARAPILGGGALALALLASAPATAQPTTGPVTPPTAPPAAADPYADVAPPPAAPRPAVVRAPRVLSPITTAYPEGGKGNASVVLEVVVEANGQPSSIRVTRGEAPFSLAAIAAASGFRYRSAERDGVPVQGRFMLRVPFREPKTPPPAPVAKQPVARKPVPVARKPGSPIEVVVPGTSVEAPREAGARLASRDIERMPGAFGDAFRAVEVLPGVVPFATGLPFFFVRGAAPSSTHYFIEGVRVPQLLHVGAGPSVFSGALLERVDLHAGANPAAYGRQIGGVVAATLKAPASETHAEGLVRLFDAGAFVSHPLDDGRASVFAAARIGYPNVALALVSPDTRIAYWDYQAGGGYALTPRDRVSVLAFGSRDRVGEIDDEGRDATLLDTQFHRVSLRLDHRPGDGDAKGGPTARVALTLGTGSSFIDEQGDVGDESAEVRGDVELPVGDKARLRGGVDMTIDSFELQSIVAAEASEVDLAFLEAFRSRTAGTFGGYADVVLRPTKSIELVPGLRTDVYSEEGAATIALDPRASLRLSVLPALTLVSAVGLVHQRPSILLAAPGLEPSGIDHGLQESLQWSEGLEIALPERVTAHLTYFHERGTGLTDLAATCSTEVETCSLNDRAEGRAYGLEVLVARPFSEKLGGLISYTLSRAERTVLGRTFASDFDRTHVFHAALGYSFGDGFQAGARFTAYTGRPYSLVAFDDPDEPTVIGRRNVLRRAPFYRLDLRVEKRWRIGRTGWVSAIAEGMNVTLSKETIDVDCRAADLLGAGADGDCGAREIGPVTIPSVGLAGGF